MTGKEYFNWFTEEEKSKWLQNFQNDDLQSDLDTFMGREFPYYHTFFFLSFNVHKSNEGEQYWFKIYHKNKKYDNLNVRPGFSFFRGKPKTF